uniref:Ig-like domain-containing protein n=1 Tax=Myripristis murdjan TaxID=586833 RepID=A0A667WH17_9TELE
LTADMKHWLTNILILTLWKGEDRVIQHGGDVIATEGETLTLACTFQTSDNSPTLFWYKQEVNDFPKFMLRQSADPRISTKLSEDKRGVDLEISSAAVTHSALYYCAVKPTSHSALTPNPEPF